MSYAAISHVGLFVRDLHAMKDYYTKVLGFVVTDEAPPKMAFLSRNPREHHQIALFAGRNADTPQVQQLSFRLGSLEEVRAVYRNLTGRGTEDMRCVSHGIAWSIYFPDPEGNRLEFFTDTEWYVRQPCADPIDFSLSADEIYRTTEVLNRQHPDFQPLETWQARFAETLERRLNETA
jgi:catechol 2,3-dioxygenase